MRKFSTAAAAVLLMIFTLVSCKTHHSSDSADSFSGLDEKNIKYTVNLYEKGLIPDNADKAVHNTKVINKAIKSADEFTRIVIPDGTYYIDCCISFQNKSNISLCGGGNTRLINTAYKPITEDDKPEITYTRSNFFAVNNSRNISVCNLTLDYLHHSTLDGVITRVENGKTYFKAYGEFISREKNPVNGGEICFSALIADDDVFYDEVWLDSGKAVIKESSDGTFSIPLQAGKAGDRICCRISSGTYSSPLFFVTETSGLTVGGITCHSCPSAFIYAPYGNSNFSFSSLNVKPQGDSQRLLASNEDIIHIKHMSGFLNLSDSTFFGLGDDVLNVHSKLVRIKNIDGNKVHTTLADNDSELPQCFFAKGQILEFFDGDGKSLGTSSVVSFNGKVLVPQSIPDGVSEGCLIQNISCVPDTTVSNCSIGFGRARGLLLQTKNATVKNCSFKNLRLSAILIAPDFKYWYEAGYADNVEISSNRFKRCASLGNGFGVIHIGTSHDNPSSQAVENGHKSITLKDNIFTRCKSEEVKATGVENFTNCDID